MTGTRRLIWRSAGPLKRRSISSRRRKRARRRSEAPGRNRDGTGTAENRPDISSADEPMPAETGMATEEDLGSDEGEHGSGDGAPDWRRSLDWH